jgi:hypothetical protein
MILDDSVRPSSFASARIHSRRTRCLPPKNPPIQRLIRSILEYER